MKRINITAFIAFLALSLACQSFAEDTSGFVRREGNKLMLDGREIHLRGICFGNNVFEGEWDNYHELPYTHHDEKDYMRIKSWGMNVIRFYMNYKTFEDDCRPFKYKQTGWEWLDRNIAWAKKYGIYLILDMHVPQGGTQYTNEGTGLWFNKKNQRRYMALWKAIAKRYANEKIIAGYDLLNEPVVTRSIDQWRDLANRTVKEIRSVDKNHVMVMECILGIMTDWRSFHRAENIFLINDDNVLYSFHFYFPFSFSHQFAIWTGMKKGGKYPDNDLWENTIDRRQMRRNRDYLEYEMMKYVDFSRKNNVPVYCGEFGVDFHSFEKNRGGVNWVNDMLDIMIKYNIDFTYHCYHEGWFGVFQNDEGLPDENYANRALINLFKSKLHDRKEPRILRSDDETSR